MPPAPSCISVVFSRSSSNSSFSPPQFTGLYCVGWVHSAHGIRGEIFVRLNAGVADWADDVETLSLLAKGAKDVVAFKIQKISAHKDGLIVRLEGVVDRNRAEEIAKSLVYIDEDLLESEEGEAIYLKQILGFKLLDPAGLILGEITGFATNGMQDLLRVKTPDGKEALVPLVAAFLQHIDFDKQQVTMDLPPGLFNLED